MEQTFVMNGIRSFFATIDRAIYGLISVIYEIIVELANATIISSSAIEDLYARIYTLLGIFMLFKITFSFINYIINPDSFTDKAKGVQNLVRNVLIVLVMIIITPYAFHQLNRVQRAILSDEIIPKFIMGIATDESGGELKNRFQMSDECGGNFGVTATSGDFIALSVFRPFYQLETTTTDIPEGYCATGTVTPSTYLKKDIYNKDRLIEDTYLVDYKFFLSTIVGLFVALIMVSFCMDIASRSIKMAFFQMIAPVPIMSYIDPASGKNGTFSKWLKQVFVTWGSLFIRLIALFFAVHIISIIDIDVIAAGSEHKFWMLLFIVIGALMVAKAIPSILETLFPGLKMGGLKLNPFKKIADEALGGKQALGGAAALAGIGLGAASWAGSVYHNRGQNKLKNLEKRRDLAAKKYGENDARTDYWQQKYDDAKQELENKKLAREARLDNIRGTLHIDEMALHPVTNTMKELTRGLRQMKDAANVAYKQGSSQKFSVVGVGKESSQLRDYKDRYTTWDRTKDAATDFFGVKNESGTTSKTKDDIRAQEQLIASLQENLRMMNNSFSNLYTQLGANEVSQMLVQDPRTGLYSFNQNYDVDDAVNNRGIDRSAITNMQAILTQIANTTKAQHDAQKEMNRLQKIRDSRPGSKAA